MAPSQGLSTQHYRTPTLRHTLCDSVHTHNIPLSICDLEYPVELSSDVQSRGHALRGLDGNLIMFNQTYLCRDLLTAQNYFRVDSTRTRTPALLSVQSTRMLLLATN